MLQRCGGLWGDRRGPRRRRRRWRLQRWRRRRRGDRDVALVPVWRIRHRALRLGPMVRRIRHRPVCLVRTGWRARRRARCVRRGARGLTARSVGCRIRCGFGTRCSVLGRSRGRSGGRSGGHGFGCGLRARHRAVVNGRRWDGRRWEGRRHGRRRDGRPRDDRRRDSRAVCRDARPQRRVLLLGCGDPGLQMPSHALHLSHLSFYVKVPADLPDVLPELVDLSDDLHGGRGIASTARSHPNRMREGCAQALHRLDDVGADLMRDAVLPSKLCLHGLEIMHESRLGGRLWIRCRGMRRALVRGKYSRDPPKCRSDVVVTLELVRKSAVEFLAQQVHLMDGLSLTLPSLCKLLVDCRILMRQHRSHVRSVLAPGHNGCSHLTAQFAESRSSPMRVSTWNVVLQGSSLAGDGPLALLHVMQMLLKGVLRVLQMLHFGQSVRLSLLCRLEPLLELPVLALTSSTLACKAASERGTRAVPRCLSRSADAELAQDFGFALESAPLLLLESPLQGCNRGGIATLGLPPSGHMLLQLLLHLRDLGVQGVELLRDHRARRLGKAT